MKPTPERNIIQSVREQRVLTEVPGDTQHRQAELMRSQEQRIITSVRRRVCEDLEAPPLFYLAFNFDAREKKDVDAVLSQTLRGVKGISSSEATKVWWQGVARDAMLTMPGQATVQANSLTPMPYDDPEGMLANKGAYYSRMLERRRLSDCLFVLGEYMAKALHQDNSLLGNQVDPLRLREVANHAWNLPRDSEWRTRADQASSVAELAPVLLEGVEIEADERDERKKTNSFSSSWYERQLLKAVDEVGSQSWQQLVYNGMLLSAQTYANEEEWLVDDQVFHIPDGSTLTIITSTIQARELTTYTLELGRIPDLEELDPDSKEHIERYMIDKYDLKILEELLALEALKDELAKHYTLQFISSLELDQWKRSPEAAAIAGWDTPG